LASQVALHYKVQPTLEKVLKPGLQVQLLIVEL